MTTRAFRRTLLAVAASSAVVALPLHALAGHGYTQYQQTFSSTPPSGYSIAPATTPRNATVTYTFTATDNSLFLFSAPLTATVFVERVRTYTPQGGTATDVSDGRTSASEADILGAAAITGDTPATQPLSPQSQTFSGGQSAQYDESVRIGGCGYWVIYVASEEKTTFANDDGTILNAGVVRVTDGCAAPTPTPPPTQSAPPATGSPSNAPAPSRPPGATQRPGAAPEAGPSRSPSATASPSPQAVAVTAQKPTNPPFPFANAGNVVLTPAPDPAQLEGAGTSNTYAQRSESLLGGSLFFAAAIIIATGLVASAYICVREMRKPRRRPA